MDEREGLNVEIRDALHVHTFWFPFWKFNRLDTSNTTIQATSRYIDNVSFKTGVTSFDTNLSCGFWTYYGDNKYIINSNILNLSQSCTQQTD